MKPIQFISRRTGATETEAVYGEKFLRLAYETGLGRLTLHALIRRPLFSRWYGWRMSRPASRRLIAPFLEHYNLDAQDFAKAPEEFTSFNDFFARQLRPEARPLASTPFILPADGRHLAFPDLSQVQQVFVKGQHFDLPALLGDPALAARYATGSLLLSRLCPTDYHRFHFPASGTPGPARLLNGPLYSVSPIALRRHLSYLWQNKRIITPLHTPSGEIQIIEVGATCVGSITQTFAPGAPVQKGQEKGFFSFGGSTVLLLFEPGQTQFTPDLLTHTQDGYETHAEMGTPLGKLPSTPS